MSETIEIPSGIESSENSPTYIKLKSKGNEFFEIKNNSEKLNKKISKTDVFIKLKIEDHNYFKRQGKDDIKTDNFVSVSTYVLGGEIEIGTIHGRKKIIITPYANEVRIKNMGVNKKGDHIASINIRLPSKMNKEQERIFEQIKNYGL